jgi:hypothetical protein
MTHPGQPGVEYEAAPEQVPHLEDVGWEQVPGQDVKGETWPAELRRFEGQDQVRMRHPEVEGEIVVAESAKPFHREKGWQVVTDEAEAEKPDDDGLEVLTVAELQDYARGAGLPVSGTKAELLERLRSTPDHDQAEPAEPAAKEE